MWPLKGTTADAELDFVAHVPESNVIELHSGMKVVASKLVSIHFSPNVTGVIPPVTVDMTSPDVGITGPARYLFAEITCGGLNSAKAKLEQLERACALAVAKASNKTNASQTILAVVTLAVVVCPKDFVGDLFGILEESTCIYPQVRELFLAGRFVYMQDRLTMGEHARITTEQIQMLSSDMCELKGDLGDLKTSLDKLVLAFEGKPSDPSSAAVEPEPAVDSWLATHLRRGGLSTSVVQDCTQKLVANEGFMEESDFAEASSTDITKTYLTRIGIRALGVQNRILKLHKQLQAQRATDDTTTGGNATL